MAIPVEDTNIYLRRPWMNPILILINVIVFVLSVAAPQLLGARSFDGVILRYGLIPILVVNGLELYRLVTHMFLHGGLLHILGNMLFLYIFGDNVESAMGPWRYLLFYLLGGLCAAAIHILSIALMPPSALLNYRAFTGVDPWLVPAIGASGAISAVLGAYLILYPRSTIKAITFWLFVPIPIVVPAAIFILFWFLYQLIMGFVALSGVPTGVAFWAHIGGFIAGIALTPFFVDKQRIRMFKLYMMLYHGYDYF